MKKILIHLEADAQASVFDQITAYDSGVDNILAYSRVQPQEVRPLVHGAIFTRGGDDLKNTAVFIGGTEVAAAEQLMKEAQAAFFGDMRVSVMFDANGSNTTAAAMVRKIAAGRELRGQKALVLAGTGPVGIRAAVLLAKEGCEVLLSSRRLERAGEVCERIAANYGCQVTPAEIAGERDLRQLLAGGVTIAACCGAAGVQLLPENVLAEATELKIVADINAVPPLGAATMKVGDNGKDRGGKICYGAIAIGNLKMKIHHRAVANLFTANHLVYDFEEIYALAKEFEA